MLSVAVVIPFAGTCPHRRAALDWVLERYTQNHPGWQVRSSAGFDSSASNGRTDAPFCKAALVNPLIEASDAGIVIVSDADCWTDGLPEAVGAVEAGAPWAVPHDEVHRLSQEGTAAVLAGADWRQQALAQQPYPGMPAGGVVIARRETLLDIPMDSRFVGWGQEDASWSIALQYLAGMPWRGTASLLHLYHPEPERLTRKRGSAESWNLYRRYVAIRAYPDRMRELVEEGRDVAHRTAEQAADDHSPVGVDDR